jgi:YggT family protein
MAYVYTTSPAVRPLYSVIRIIWYLLDVLEALLLIRFTMRLLGANPAAGFTQVIYNLSYPFLAPFQAVFPRTYVLGSTFEWTTLLAMVVYWLIALAIVRLVAMGRPVSTTEAAYRVTEEDKI